MSVHERRIVIVGPVDPKAGGVASVTQALRAEWEGGGQRVVTIDPWADGLGLHSILAFLRAILRSFFLSPRVDSVHLNVASRGSTYRKMALSYVLRVRGVPYLVHLHGAQYREFYSESSALSRALIRNFFGRAASTIVLGNTWRRFACRDLGLPDERVLVIPNGVGGPDHPGDGSEGYGEGLMILFAGRLGERKGSPTLIKALSQISQVEVAWHAVVAGDGDGGATQALVDELGLSDRVTLTGWVSGGELAQLWHNSDVFVLPSRAEGLPMSMLTAMAARTAVIATPVGAVPEVIRNGVNGLLVRPDDSASLARALESVLVDGLLRRSLAEAGYETWRADFRQDLMAERVRQAHIASLSMAHSC